MSTPSSTVAAEARACVSPIGALDQVQALRRQGQRRLWLLAALLIAVTSASLFIGRYPRPYWMSPWVLGEDAMAQQIVWALRMPRVLMAVLLGAALGGAGITLQMIFRNPLVEPGFLGVSQGAAFGAAFSIVFLGSASLYVQGLAMLFAFAGVGLSYFLAQRLRYGGWVLRLVLAGVAVSAIFSAGVGLLKYLADPLTELPEITYWLLGGLWSVTWRDPLLVAPVVLSSLTVLLLMRWRLNLLALNEETSHSLGVRPVFERALMLTAAVAATASVVAIAGIVGWVGLLVPHIVRRLVGANTQLSLPAAMLGGALFVVLCDDLARSMTAGEIPLGILTSLLGAAGFLFVLAGNPIRTRE